jgi:hypothetical protein
MDREAWRAAFVQIVECPLIETKEIVGKRWVAQERDKSRVHLANAARSTILDNFRPMRGALLAHR